MSERPTARWLLEASELRKSFDAEEFARRLWKKDPTLWKNDPVHAKIIANSLGWLALPETMSARARELSAFADEVREAGFRHAAVLGMGGSSLAPEVFRRTFQPEGIGAKGLRLHVLDSTHPAWVRDLEKRAPAKETLYIVSSKSGSTVEPMRFYDHFRALAQKAVGPKSASSHFVAITDPGTSLERLAKERGFRRTFSNFPDIGGRYCALSYFGLVPAALAGVDVAGLLDSARAMADACKPSSPRNPGLDLGASLGALARCGKDKIIFRLSPAISSFGLWLEQLIAESVGKEGKGAVPVADEAPRDSYGSDRVFVFILLRNDPALPRFKKEIERLNSGGHPVLHFELPNELALGAEFLRWEVATAALGRSLGIDPFDQPNVQDAKDRTNAALAGLAKQGSLPKPAAHQKLGPLELTFSSAVSKRTLESLLDGARPGDYGGLLAYLPPKDAALSDARQKFAAALGGAAVQFGYGPRYLHSTGQLHKGGANNGIFLLLWTQPGPESPIPGSSYSFGQLCAAQALGDFEALESSGRRAALVKLTGDLDPALASLAAALDGRRS